MTRPCNLLFTTAMLAGLCWSGLEPASAQKSSNIPNISPMRPDFNMRAPNILRDRDVSDPGEAAVPNKKAKLRRTVREEDYRERAGALPRVQRAKASKSGKTTKSAAASVTNVVSDRVLKTGSTISGDWREYAADLSWRRVVFTLDGQVATVVFSDGMPGGLLPAVTRFARSGPGPKGLLATYHEVRIFPGTTPVILDKAKQSSSFPSGIGTRIRALGGDFRLLQQLMDDKRLFAELGSALDAGQRPPEAAGNSPGVPGSDFAGGGLPRSDGSDPRRGGFQWDPSSGGFQSDPGSGRYQSDPRLGAAAGRCPGCASGDTVEVGEKTTDPDGNSSQMSVTTHSDGSTMTVVTYRDADGTNGVIRTDRNSKGYETGSTSWTHSTSGVVTKHAETHNANTGEVTYTTTTSSPDGQSSMQNGRCTPPHCRTPSETGGRGVGIDPEMLAIAPTWMIDAIYIQWKRESDLVKSGGRIAQPGRGEQSTLILNEGPEVGVEGVVNCGAETNPCARAGGVAVDARRGFRNISQPPIPRP